MSQARWLSGALSDTTGRAGSVMPVRLRSPVWFWSSIWFAIILGLCVGLSLVDNRLLLGVSVWSKPIKFAASLGLFFFTLAWFANLGRTTTNGSGRTDYFVTVGGRVLVWLPVFWGFAEMVYILWQAANGQASHYNHSSAFTQIAYGIMGFGAVTMVACCLWLSYVILQRHSWRNPYVFAVVTGLVLTFVLGGGLGGYLSAGDGHWVGGVASDAEGLPLVGWATLGGDLRVAHFFGMHAMQVVPVFAWLLAIVGPTWLNQLNQWRSVFALAAVYTGLTLATFWQARTGFTADLMCLVELTGADRESDGG